jgi:hypothetical protein
MVKKQEVEEALKRLAESQKVSEGLISAHDFIEEVDQAEREISAQTHYFYRRGGSGRKGDFSPDTLQPPGKKK